MTNGTSQGLFITVAVVIFGIFVFMADTILGVGLTNSLVEVFTGSIDNVAGGTVVADPEDLENVERWDLNLEDEDKILFDDEALAKIVSDALEVPVDDITYGKLKSLRALSIPTESKIYSFKGIEYAKNLESISLEFGSLQGSDSNLLGYLPEHTVVSSNGFKESVPKSNLDVPNDTVIFIRDIFLRQAIRDELDLKAPQPITKGDISKLTDLDAQNKGIIYLDGIEYAENLVRIDLSHNYLESPKFLEKNSKLIYADVGYNLISAEEISEGVLIGLDILITEGNL